MERNNVSSPDFRPFAIRPAASSERSPNRHEVLATPDRLFWCALAEIWIAARGSDDRSTGDRAPLGTRALSGTLGSGIINGIVVSLTAQPSGTLHLSTDLTTRAEPRKLNWTNSVALGLLHCGALAALFVFSWYACAVAVFLHWMCGGLGISMGYHRLHTHRSYQVPLALEYFFAVCGTLALQGGPIFWVSTHRIHHHKSDQPGDPHSPRDGGWWAHIGWLLVGECKQSDTAWMSKYAPDLAKDRFYVWLNTYHWVPLVVLAVLLLAIGGVPFLLWGICLRVVIGLHSTWLVNSATHMWGSRRFATRDDSRNNWWVALMTSGEGWHNNHHAHPTSARHGLMWYEFDLSWIQIEILKFFGLAKSVRVAKLTRVRAELDVA